MACYLYNNQGYVCGGCCHFVRSTSVTLTGTVLSITIPEQRLRNHERVCICIAQSIPEGINENTTVAIVLGTQTINVITRCSNLLYADQIRSRQILKLFAATDLPYFVTAKDCKLCKTRHTFPVIPVATTSATTSVDGNINAIPTTSDIKKGSGK